MLEWWGPPSRRGEEAAMRCPSPREPTPPVERSNGYIRIGFARAVGRGSTPMSAEFPLGEGALGEALLPLEEGDAHALVASWALAPGPLGAAEPVEAPKPKRVRGRAAMATGGVPGFTSDSSGKFVCDSCPYTTQNPLTAASHTRFLHPKQGPSSLACSLCAFRTSYSSSLKRHVTNFHTTVAPS